ncbi:unnamed protein product [Coregonus sp. 'balchen']|nr:unnamed protein product [Coregonus sp. 'balchen']
MLALLEGRHLMELRSSQPVGINSTDWFTLFRLRKAYPPEFYYDTYSPLWQNRPTTGLQRWWEQEIPVDGTITKGELITHNLTELIKPAAYESCERLLLQL